MAGAVITTACFILCSIFNICQCREPSGISGVPATNNSSDICDIQDLLTKHDSTSLRCSSFVDEFLVDDLTVCWVNNQDALLEYQCEEGLWKPTTGTGLYKRQKRFLFFVILYCVISKKCFSHHENRNKPPAYKDCPQSGKVYEAERKQTSCKVTWKKPKAQDDDKVVKETSTYQIGHQFTGYPAPDGKDYSVTYTASDKQGLKATCSFKFTVKYFTCPVKTTLQNGRLSSCSHNNIYGSECTYDCYKGYKMVGGATATCLKNGTWDNTPICQKIRCPTPFNLLNGNVACDDKSYYFETHCSFQCDNGFKIDGPRQMTCQADKTWSVAAPEVSCKDEKAPEITCSPPKVFYANRSSFSAAVSWDEPTAIDNTDPHPDIVKLSGPSQGDVLKEGTHHVTYKASDVRGNFDPRLSKCDITLEVKVVRCSTGPSDAMSNSRFIMFNCTDASFYNGVSCNLECDLNLPLNGSDTMSCERDGTSGNGVWVWQSSEPFCKVVECPPLDPPANGAFTTDSVNARPLHVMLCQNGYDIPAVGSAFQGRLSCQDSGEWYPLSAFPDCIVAVLSLLKLPAELYYEGDCNSNATAEQIKKQVLVYLTGVKADIDQSICPDVDTCKVENLNVVCGGTTRRRRRTALNNERAKRQSNFALVTWDLITVFDKGNKTVNDAFRNVLGVFKDLETKIKTDVTNGKLDVAGFTLASDAFKMDSKPTFACKSGYKLDAGSVSCKPCPSGTYLNSTTNDCEYCIIGKYIEYEGASSCKSCPVGYSTLSEGTKAITDCIKLCSPGYFSSTMMEPCLPCPVGSFQPFQGQISCALCPPGTATNETNSKSASDCEIFDIFFGHTSQTTVIGSFTAEEDTSLSVSFWLKLTELEKQWVSISIADTSGYKMNLTLDDYIAVGSGSSSEVKTNRTFPVDQWAHVLCIVNITSNAIKLFVDGTLEAKEDGALFDLPSKLSRGTVELDNYSKGIFISGFVIYSRALNDTEVSSHSQTCSIEKNDEIFSMTNILQNNLQGSSIIFPTACDPINECKSGLCGDHKCINTAGGFQCICHGGMTGDLCNVPPDYCMDNGCKHGDCIPSNGTYFCNCSDGYTGIFCTDPPVNGGWSEWQGWSKCTISCGNGTRERSRKCNDPSPGYMGSDCGGEKLEIESCNEQICPTCPKLERRYGTVVTCTDDLQENRLECKMICIRGKVLPNGQRPFESYWCGASTDYQWLPTYKLPDCVDATVPDAFGTQASISYKDSIPDSDKESVQTSIEQRLSVVGCLKNQTCQLTSTFSSENRNKRSVTSKILLRFSIKLTDKDNFTLGDYLSNGTESPAMTEFLNAKESANEIMQFIEDNSTDIFDVSVGGEDYTADTSSLSLAATVTCKDGYAGADGYCAQCTAGTKLEFPDCVDCDVGTYQPLSGQKDCLPCPKGSTTPTAGASHLSECSVILETTTSSTVTVPTDKTDVDVKLNKRENDDEDKTILIIVIVICVVVVFCAVAVGGVCLMKRYNKRLFWINNEKVSKLDAHNEGLQLSTVSSPKPK